MAGLLPSTVPDFLPNTAAYGASASAAAPSAAAEPSTSVGYVHAIRRWFDLSLRRFPTDEEPLFKLHKAKGMKEMHTRVAEIVTVAFVAWEAAAGLPALLSGAFVTATVVCHLRNAAVVVGAWMIAASYHQAPAWMATHSDRVFSAWSVFLTATSAMSFRRILTLVHQPDLFSQACLELSPNLRLSEDRTAYRVDDVCRTNSTFCTAAADASSGACPVYTTELDANHEVIVVCMVMTGLLYVATTSRLPSDVFLVTLLADVIAYAAVRAAVNVDDDAPLTISLHALCLVFYGAVVCVSQRAADVAMRSAFSRMRTKEKEAAVLERATQQMHEINDAFDALPDRTGVAAPTASRAAWARAGAAVRVSERMLKFSRRISTANLGAALPKKMSMLPKKTSTLPKQMSKRFSTKAPLPTRLSTVLTPARRPTASTLAKGFGKKRRSSGLNALAPTGDSETFVPAEREEMWRRRWVPPPLGLAPNGWSKARAGNALRNLLGDAVCDAASAAKRHQALLGVAARVREPTYTLRDFLDDVLPPGSPTVHALRCASRTPTALFPLTAPHCHMPQVLPCLPEMQLYLAIESASLTDQLPASRGSFDLAECSTVSVAARASLVPDEGAARDLELRLSNDSTLRSSRSSLETTAECSVASACAPKHHMTYMPRGTRPTPFAALCRCRSHASRSATARPGSHRRPSTCAPSAPCVPSTGSRAYRSRTSQGRTSVTASAGFALGSMGRRGSRRARRSSRSLCATSRPRRRCRPRTTTSSSRSAWTFCTRWSGRSSIRSCATRASSYAPGRTAASTPTLSGWRRCSR
jgi:hypothetical protein